MGPHLFFLFQVPAQRSMVKCLETGPVLECELMYYFCFFEYSFCRKFNKLNYSGMTDEMNKMLLKLITVASNFYMAKTIK